MKSMTGFGRADRTVQGFRIHVEVQSINQKRGLDVSLNLPREYSHLEQPLRDLAGAGLSRGRVSLSLTVKAVHPGGEFRIDRKRLKDVHKELKALGKELDLPGEVSLEFLLKIPGVILAGEAATAPETLQKEVLAVAKVALAQMHAFRDREGAHLAKELKRLFVGVGKKVTSIDRMSGRAKRDLRLGLERRLREAGLVVGPDDERVAREVVLLVEKSDLTEELARLEAHLMEAVRLLSSGDPAGRTLEFLLQEIGREVNTIGSKSQTLAITQDVVAIKAELEKIREQIQNLE
jgi:uncharacterized protein (TIGR00255 family)